MIDVKELRIGNIVRYANKSLVIDSILKGRIGFDHERYDPNPSFLEPIPLTPEILVKCGFENGYKDHGDDYAVLFGKNTGNSNGLFLFVDLDKHSCRMGQLLHFSHDFGNIEYLHQLQNLFFALTQTELKIEL